MKHIRIMISGNVHGVGFRYEAKKIANSLHLTGTIKNMSDGTVVCNAHGTDRAIDSFVSWCHQGPPGAQVTNVIVSDIAAIHHYDSFSVIEGV